MSRSILVSNSAVSLHVPSENGPKFARYSLENTNRSLTIFPRVLRCQRVTAPVYRTILEKHNPDKRHLAAADGLDELLEAAGLLASLGIQLAGLTNGTLRSHLLLRQVLGTVLELRLR